jgi:hypothetical protein
MPYWTTLTLPQLRAATKAEILQNVGTYIAANFTKRQIIMWLVQDDPDGDGRVALPPVREYEGPGGQVSREDVAICDLETAKKVGGTRTLWTYYETGEVDTITLLELDPDDGMLARRVIKHYRGGRQPEVE